MEVYRGGLICYSLGNFLFGSVNPYQTQNLVLRVDVRKQDRKLRAATLYPVQGAYRNTGHAIRMVPPSESREFWQEFYLQSRDLNPNFKQRFRISESGTGEITIASQNTRTR
jgi:poly-gamma-glutamate capsule biosynthesis protein CapA/YwtB (metallophosphatase superfamily)